MFCTKCGFEIKDGYKFCPKCGTPTYVEKEEPKGDMQKGDIDDSIDNESVVKSTETVKKTSKAKTASKSKKIESESKIKNKFIPNPLISEELDIENIKKESEQGDRWAMLRLAFRYEMGIGVERDLDKAEELYKKAGGDNHTFFIDDFPDYLFAVINDNLCIINESKK